MLISHISASHYTPYCFNNNYPLPAAPKPLLDHQRSIQFRQPAANLSSRYPAHPKALAYRDSPILYRLSHRQSQNVPSVVKNRQYQEIVEPLFLTRSRLLDEQERAPSASMPSMHSPRISPDQLYFDQQILPLVEAVLRGKQQTINYIVSCSQSFFDQKTLTQHLKTELITFAKQQLLNTDSAFSKKEYQTVVDQLSARTNQLLSSPETLHVPSTPAKFPQPDYFNRQNSLNRQLSYSQLDKQATLILKQFQETHCAKNKKYPDFYQGHFFNSHETIISACSTYQSREDFLKTLDKILNSNYNNFCANQILPLGEHTFFHQQQNGPYCQTVSVNNFLGDRIITPENLISLNLGDKHIGEELTTSRTLELMSVIRLQQKKLLEGLIENSKNTLINSPIKKAIETAKYLIKELNCRITDLEPGNQRQQQKIIQAAEKSGINRLHLTFLSSQNSMHAIALRRDPANPKLWIVLDGNLHAHRLSLKDALQGYSRKGCIRLLARKDLFKTDPSIACYQIKRKSTGELITAEPEIGELSDWRGVSPQLTQARRFSIPERIDNDLYFWKIKNPTARRKRARSLPPRLSHQTYRDAEHRRFSYPKIAGVHGVSNH